MTHNKPTQLRRTLSLSGCDLHLRQSESEDKPSRTIEGYAILFNVPSEPLWADEASEAREVIAPEAITRELLDGSDIKFTMYHDRRIILGRSKNGAGTLKYSIDDKGVAFTLELPDTPNGAEALELVKRGDISGCSFAFATLYGDPEYVSREAKREGNRMQSTYTVRKITGVYDFTLAGDPAYPQTSVEARELRRMLSPEPRKEAKSEKAAAQIAEMRRQAKF